MTPNPCAARRLRLNDQRALDRARAVEHSLRLRSVARGERANVDMRLNLRRYQGFCRSDPRRAVERLKLRDGDTRRAPGRMRHDSQKVAFPIENDEGDFVIGAEAHRLNRDIAAPTQEHDRERLDGAGLINKRRFALRRHMQRASADVQARFFARHGEDRRFDRRALSPISPVISQRLRSPPLVYEAGMFGRRVSDAGPWPPSVSLEHDRKRRPRIRLGGGRRIAEIGGPLVVSPHSIADGSRKRQVDHNEDGPCGDATTADGPRNLDPEGVVDKPSPSLFATCNWGYGRWWETHICGGKLKGLDEVHL